MNRCKYEALGVIVDPGGGGSGTGLPLPGLAKVPTLQTIVPGTTGQGHIYVTPEWYVYGNAGQGQFAEVYPYLCQIDTISVSATQDVTMKLKSPLSSEHYAHKKNYKVYNIKDHLGNVRLKFSDLRNDDPMMTLNLNGVYNYYPFGSQIPSMTWEDTDARFGFQGQQRDDEIAGKGNSLNTLFRQNNTQTGVWLSVDPEVNKYPDKSPFILYGCNPVWYVDARGDDIVVLNPGDRDPVLEMINSKALGTFDFDKNGKLYLATSHGDETTHSTYYRDRLVEAIGDDQKIEISISQIASDVDAKPKKINGIPIGGYFSESTGNNAYNVDDPFLGGGITFLPPSGIDDCENIKVVISGNPDSAPNRISESSGAWTLLHELLGHAIPYTIGSDTGNAVENENKARQQIRPEGFIGPMPIRKADPGHTERM